jgi:hypothetical protein
MSSECDVLDDFDTVIVPPVQCRQSAGVRWLVSAESTMSPRRG